MGRGATNAKSRLPSYCPGSGSFAKGSAEYGLGSISLISVQGGINTEGLPTDTVGLCGDGVIAVRE